MADPDLYLQVYAVRPGPAHVAEGALNRLCAGDPVPTFTRMLAFERALWALFAVRCANRVRNQGWRCLLRWRNTP